MLTSGHPPEAIIKVLTYGHSPGHLNTISKFWVKKKFVNRRLASLDRYSSKGKPWSEQWRTRAAKLRERIGLLERFVYCMLR